MTNSIINNNVIPSLGGGFKYLLLSPLLGEDFHFVDHIVSNGLVQPPRSSAIHNAIVYYSLDSDVSLAIRKLRLWALVPHRSNIAWVSKFHGFDPIAKGKPRWNRRCFSWGNWAKLKGDDEDEEEEEEEDDDDDDDDDDDEAALGGGAFQHLQISSFAIIELRFESASYKHHV